MHVRGVEWLARMAARAGVVHADPWSDRRLAEFVLAVPQWALQRRSHLKGIAYQAMRGIVPEPVRPRLAKVTPQPFFNLSLRTWAQDRVWRLLSGMDAAAHGYVDQAALRRHYTEILGGRPPRDEFWWALTLEMWLRHYVS
jgi:asparagine synthase (glutamine-hydrolysing)